MIFYDIINPFNVNFGEIYYTYRYFFDPVLAFLLFLSLASFVFRNKYKGREGKGVAAAVAMALTFGFVMLELSTGFYFGHPIMQGLAGLVMLLVFGILLYELLAMMFGEKGKACAIAFTYFIIYGTLMSAYSPLYQQLYAYSSIVAGILALGFLFSLVAVVLCMVKMLKVNGGGTPPGPPGPAGPAGQTGPPGPSGTGGNTPPGARIRVTIRQPVNGQRFAVGADIHVLAEVHNGANGYVWQWDPHPSAGGHQGRSHDPNIQTHYNNLPPGVHQIRLAVVDEHDNSNSDGDDVSVIIGGGPPPPPQPNDVAQLRQRIQDYQLAVRTFHALVQQYRPAAQNLITVMQGVFAGTATIANLGIAVNQLNSATNRIAQITPVVRQLAQQIAQNPALLAQLTQAEVNALTQAHNQYFTSAAQLAADDQWFQQQYNNIP